MDWAALILGLVTAQRLGELVLARRNTRRLLAQGAHEVGAAHYPLIVALHALWLFGLWYMAVYRASLEQDISLPWLAVFIALQLGRLWVIASLGGRWTTRILVLPGEPLVQRGPYRFLSHPNYWVVAGELLVRWSQGRVPMHCEPTYEPLHPISHTQSKQAQMTHRLLRHNRECCRLRWLGGTQL